MPKTAASAWMKLDEALLYLQRAQQQIGVTGDPAQQGPIVQQAIVHVEAAMELIK